jgi:RNA 3'-terminal phosphate cyclase
MTIVAEYTEQELAWIDARICACGCKGSVAHRGIRTLYLEGHRQRRHKRKVKAAARAAGLPDRLSLQTVLAASPTAGRSGDAPAPVRRRQRKPRPGVQVYLPSVGHAQLLEAIVAGADRGQLPQEIAEEIAEAVRRAIERRRRGLDSAT